MRRANALEGKEESWYVTVAIAATENMRAAHVLKSFTRERIYKVSSQSYAWSETDAVVD